MAKQYEVPALGSGTQDDPFRPDLPDGSSFVGQYDTETNTYLVIVSDSATIGAKAGRRVLLTAKEKENELAVRKLSADDVGIWSVG